MPRKYKSSGLDRTIGKKKLNDLYDSIIGVREDRHTEYTDEQEFLIQYFNMQEEEIPENDFNFSNFVRDVYGTERISDDVLQTIRFRELMNLESLTYSIFKQYYNREQIKSDRFHEPIERFEQYLEIESDIEQNPTPVKKMRILQLINRIAHKYDSIYKKILYLEMPQLRKSKYSNNRRIEYNIGKIFSKNENDVNRAMILLSRYLEADQIEALKQNKALKYCIETRDWMFNEKDRYMIELTKDLSKEDGGYSYGLKEDESGRKMLIFDVPGYGQFAVHFGESERKILPILTEDYEVRKFEGINLKKEIYILSRPNMDYVETVQPELMSEEDRYLYDIVKQDPYNEPKKLREEKRIEDVIAECRDPERARKIYEILKQQDVSLEVITKMVLENGNSELIPDIVRLAKESNINLEKCKSLLSIGINQVIEIYEVMDKIDELGIDRSILQEAPTFLRTAKAERIAPIYEVLKKYKIKLTNENMGDAFGYNAANIQSNLDLAIENGLYEFAQNGVTSFFSVKNKSLNMRMNLLRTQNEDLMVVDREKRKINGTMFRTEKDLMKRYGITKKEVLDKLSEVQGQELLEENEYAKLIKQDEPQIGKRKQTAVKKIYQIIEKMETQRGVVLQIGDYYYSAIKVKRQIASIVENMQLKDITDEQALEIIRAALFKNKNIDEEEVAQVGEMVEILGEEFRKEESLSKRKQKGRETKKSDNVIQIRRRIERLKNKIKKIEQRQATATRARNLARDEIEKMTKELQELKRKIRKIEGKEKT